MRAVEFQSPHIKQTILFYNWIFDTENPPGVRFYFPVQAFHRNVLLVAERELLLLPRLHQQVGGIRGIRQVHRAIRRRRCTRGTIGGVRAEAVVWGADAPFQQARQLGDDGA